MSDPAPSGGGQGDNEAAIALEAVSVRFRVPRERTVSLRDYAIRAFRRRVAFVDFWALREVSLALQPGEVFGLIGRNGAGKSTLLKVVARVLRPTAGRVRVRGRVAPLLGVGGGFHLELTGRENVFLKGALLGLSRKEIVGSFERIVEFAELSDFIEAPVRTYSSGMIARLGFAIATQARPEILVIDEVLSVGDAEFQRKSADRIREFRDGGSTILLVSHNLIAVEKMCARAAWLDGGLVRAVGDTAEVVRAYRAEGRSRRVSDRDAGRWRRRAPSVEKR